MIPMNKLFKKIKDNNKGFTLVELIVVIAVLAVITVVAAPQYLKYVDKSKEGTDANAIGEIAHIAEIEYVELSATDKTGTIDDTIKLEITNAGVLEFTEPTDALDKLVKDITVNYTFKSDKYKGSTITIKITNGVAVVTGP